MSFWRRDFLLDQLQEKDHYKMYKDGKKWVFAGIATFTGILGGAMSAKADTTAANTTTASKAIDNDSVLANKQSAVIPADPASAAQNASQTSNQQGTSTATSAQDAKTTASTTDETTAQDASQAANQQGSSAASKQDSAKTADSATADSKSTDANSVAAKGTDSAAAKPNSTATKDASVAATNDQLTNQNTTAATGTSSTTSADAKTAAPVSDATKAAVSALDAGNTVSGQLADGTVVKNGVTLINPTQQQINDTKVALKTYAAETGHPVSFAAVDAAQVVTPTTDPNVLQSESYNAGYWMAYDKIDDMKGISSATFLINGGLKTAMTAAGRDPDDINSDIVTISKLFDAVRANGGQALSSDGTVSPAILKILGLSVPSNGADIFSSGTRWSTSNGGGWYNHGSGSWPFYGPDANNAGKVVQSSWYQGVAGGVQQFYDAWTNYIAQLKANFSDPKKVNDFLNNTKYDVSQMNAGAFSISDAGSFFANALTGVFSSGSGPVGTAPFQATAPTPMSTADLNNRFGTGTSAYNDEITYPITRLISSVRFMISAVIKPIESVIMYQAFNNVGALGLNQGGVDLPKDFTSAMSLNATLQSLVSVFGFGGVAASSAGGDMYKAISDGILSTILKEAAVGQTDVLTNIFSGKQSATGATDFANFTKLSGWSGDTKAWTKDSAANIAKSSTFTTSQDASNVSTLNAAAGAYFASRYDAPVIQQAIKDALANVQLLANGQAATPKPTIDATITKIFQTNDLATLQRLTSQTSGSGTNYNYAPSGVAANAQLASVYDAEYNAIMQAVNDFLANPTAQGRKATPVFVNPAIANQTDVPNLPIPMSDYDTVFTYLLNRSQNVIQLGMGDANVQSHRELDGNVQAINSVPSTVTSSLLLSGITLGTTTANLTPDFPGVLDQIALRGYVSAYNGQATIDNTVFKKGVAEFNKQTATTNYINNGPSVLNSNVAIPDKDLGGLVADGVTRAFGDGFTSQQTAVIELNLSSKDASFGYPAAQTKYGVVGRNQTFVAPTVPGFIPDKTTQSMAPKATDSLTFNYTVAPEGQMTVTVNVSSTDGKIASSTTSNKLTLGNRFNFTNPTSQAGYSVDLTK
ncbi:KxYKxGKxW signal peptide domain-containing protein [Furfurilactobacillus siliginis]|uniref:Uncharacterized protein n=1 Tax=Furfurilactobacillus siliginis TaxID=348151 RepID=A0A0R2L2E7_9LACO|nr:KxYKxGKxW signal peptide domain-containing protein [Furfurilactobacillus siliginis]KRN93354.1 hypothetical protein IV55_GL001051 [Furfurilactobacillus siliginis]GEK29539.1 hypothetical protein LSI01_18500 [Furfurilactobacillus siliginis]